MVVGLVVLSSLLTVCTSQVLVPAPANSSSDHVEDVEYRDTTSQVTNSSNDHVGGVEYRDTTSQVTNSRNDHVGGGKYRDTTSQVTNSSNDHVGGSKYRDTTSQVTNSSNDHVGGGKYRDTTSQVTNSSNDHVGGSKYRDTTSQVTNSSNDHVGGGKYRDTTSQDVTEILRNSQPDLLVPTEGQTTIAPRSLDIVTSGTTAPARFTTPRYNPGSDKSQQIGASATGSSTKSGKELLPGQHNAHAERRVTETGNVTKSHNETARLHALSKPGSLDDDDKNSFNQGEREVYTATTQMSIMAPSQNMDVDQARSEIATQVADSTRQVITIGVYAITVCERAMLCAGRCFQTRDGKEWVSGVQRTTPSLSQIDVLHTDGRFPRGNHDSSSHCQQTGDNICFCDHVCVLYGDCCPDVFSSCHQLQTVTATVNYITSVWTDHFGVGPIEGENAMPLTTEGQLIKFVTEFASCQNINATTGLLLVSHCPTHSKDIVLKERCESLDGLQPPPVTVNWHFGDVTFKNVFCAHCHGFTETELLKIWSVSYVCEKSIPENFIHSLSLADLTNLVSAGMCTTSFIQPSGICRPRQCDPYFSFSHDQEWNRTSLIHMRQCLEADAILCWSYYYPSVDFHKNVHCRKCLGNPRRRKEASTNSLCNVPFHNMIVNKELYTGGILLILDLTGRYSNRLERTSFYICRDNEVFDPYTLTCRTPPCQLGSRPYRGLCVDFRNITIIEGDSQVYPNGWTLIMVTFKSSNSSDDPCVFSVTTDSTIFTQSGIRENKSCNSDAFDSQLVSTLLLTGCSAPVEDKRQLRAIMARFLTKIFDVASNTADEISLLASELENLGVLKDTYQIEVSNINSSTAASYRCSGTKILHQLWDVSIEENNGTAYVILSRSHREIYYPLGNVGFQVVLTQDSARSAAWVLNQSVYVCDTWLSLVDNCPVVTYKLNDTVHNGSRLMVLSSGLYYDDGDFLISGDEVLVCTNFSSLYAPHQSLAYVVLNWLLNIVSIISLLLMLVLYGLFPELCTLPGRMTASLAASMMLTFLFNLFTLTELHHDYICPIAAVANHVVTLAQFGWMSAIAVNMTLTFGPLTNKLARTVSDKARFLRYNLAVWGSAVVIVMTSVVLDLSHSEPNTSEITIENLLTNNYVRYGYEGCTWFSGSLLAKVIFIMIPYSMSFVICLVGFSLTLIGIQQTNRSVQKLGKKSSDKANCMIYLKLSTAMGFSWALTAFSNLYPETVVLSYIHMVLLLIQGLLLFLAFMVNNRVYLLLQEFISSKTRKRTIKEATRTSLTMAR